MMHLSQLPGCQRASAQPLVVAVITGSCSGERYYESSPWIIRALLDKGYQVVPFQVDNTNLVDELRDLRHQVAQGAKKRGEWRELVGWATGLGAGGGEEGALAALFEMLLPGMPYVGSSTRACTIAMDKEASKDAFRALGLSVPDGVCFLPYPTIVGGMRYRVSNPADKRFLTENSQPDFSQLAERLGLPLVVKPCGAGASLGLSLVKDAQTFASILRPTAERYGPLLVEQYIASHYPDVQVEYSVCLLEGAALPVLEVCSPTLYDTAAKISSSVAHPIRGELAERLQEAASAAFLRLGCRGFARFDFRVPPSDELYLLEGNVSPGLIQKWSLFSKAAEAIGLPYNDLIERILMTAFLPHRRALRSVATYDAPPFPEAFRSLLPDLPIELQPSGFYQPADGTVSVHSVLRHAC